MSIYLNTNNITIQNNITKCVYSFADRQFKNITSIYGTKESKVVKLWGNNKEQETPYDDPYQIAPASEIDDWSYTLNEIDHSITLSYYKNPNVKNVVIIYSNYEVNGKIYKTKIGNGPSSSKVNYMFKSKQYISSIIFGNNINFSETSNMSYMFAGCYALKNINFGNNFDTSNVTNMYMMFNCCSALEELDLSSFNTSNVTNMSSMFNRCTALEELDLSSFNTSNVTNMSLMFYGSSNLKIIYVNESIWSIPDDVRQMFFGCGTSSVTYK